jgi:hypothetical protein
MYRLLYGFSIKFWTLYGSVDGLDVRPKLVTWEKCDCIVQDCIICIFTDWGKKQMFYLQIYHLHNSDDVSSKFSRDQCIWDWNFLSMSSAINNGWWRRVAGKSI